MISFLVNICEYLVLGNDAEAGEPALAELLSGFSCSKNKYRRYGNPPYAAVCLISET